MLPVAFFGATSPWHVLIVLVIVLLLFGNRLPSVMRSLGRGMVEFKKGMEGIEDDTEGQEGAKDKAKEPAKEPAKESAKAKETAEK